MDFSVIPKVWVSNSPRASVAPGALQGLAAAVRALGSAVVGPAAPVVAQAAAPTPRAAAAPGADTAAGGDWGVLFWGHFGGHLEAQHLGGELGRWLAPLLVLLASWQEIDQPARE